MTKRNHLSRRDMLHFTALAPAGLAGIAAALDTDLSSAAETSSEKPTESDGFCIHPDAGTAMKGFPPDKEDIVTADTQATRRDQQRWALRHAREMMPTQCIRRGSGPIAKLTRNPIPVPQFNKLEFAERDGKTRNIASFAERQHVDALLVMHDGKIVNEQYFGGMTPNEAHDLYSAGKALTSTLIATMLGNQLSEQERIERYVPELAGTGYEGATIRELLDMRSGIKYRYSLSPDSELQRHMSMTTGAPSDSGPQGQWELLRSFERVRPHGQEMRYKETDVLAVTAAAERVSQTRFADLFSQCVWSKLGAEYDAYVRCDGWGMAAPSFGMCATCRDLARWGQMCLQQGWYNDRQIVPSEYFSDLRKGHKQKIDFQNFIENDFGLTMLEGTGYRSYFWFPGRQTKAFAAFGGYGQTVYVSWEYNTVVVCLSSWMPGDDMQALDHAQGPAFEQISKLTAALLG